MSGAGASMQQFAKLEGSPTRDESQQGAHKTSPANREARHGSDMSCGGREGVEVAAVLHADAVVAVLGVHDDAVVVDLVVGAVVVGVRV